MGHDQVLVSVKNQDYFVAIVVCAYIWWFSRLDVDHLLCHLKLQMFMSPVLNSAVSDSFVLNLISQTWLRCLHIIKSDLWKIIGIELF